MRIIFTKYELIQKESSRSNQILMSEGYWTNSFDAGQDVGALSLEGECAFASKARANKAHKK